MRGLRAHPREAGGWESQLGVRSKRKAKPVPDNIVAQFTTPSAYEGSVIKRDDDDYVARFRLPGAPGDLTISVVKDQFAAANWNVNWSAVSSASPQAAKAYAECLLCAAQFAAALEAAHRVKGNPE